MEANIRVMLVLIHIMLVMIGFLVGFLTARPNGNEDSPVACYVVERPEEDR